MALHARLERSAVTFPENTAVVEPGVGSITYSGLNALADRLRDRLIALGVVPGDRVGLCIRKSIDSVATIFGILKAGAAYVPVDSAAPTARNAQILNDCSVRVVVVEGGLGDALQDALAALGCKPAQLLLERIGGGQGLIAALSADSSTQNRSAGAGPDSLAYILYTSGSTGKPKGVMISHRNAAVFLNWSSAQFRPSSEDRFSSHAPFHFDLSILDIYVPISHGASLVLISEAAGKNPRVLAELIARERITCWYSTPSILSLLAQFGAMEQHNYDQLRIVNFAGEVFPIKHLRLLRSLLPHPDFYNLYGPTETNVCTYYRIPDAIPAGQSEPFPIGRPCTHYEGHIRVVDANDREVPPGQEGELCASGPGAMTGYWQSPDRTAEAFSVDEDGKRWYHTGDVVRRDEAGELVFVGRRDRMVKKLGYRIELGEIEAALYLHPEVIEAAVVAVTDEEDGVRIKAFIACGDGGRLSLIALKRFCMEHLPAYMVPDLFSFHERLYKTSTDKIDYQKLQSIS